MNSKVSATLHNGLSRTVTAAVIAGMTVMGAAVSANAAPTRADLPAMTNDPGCDMFGWRHPMCAGGAWDESASQEWGPADTGTNPFPGAGGQMVPNTDGSLSLPGTPGAI
jgi:hypothetical protein